MDEEGLKDDIVFNGLNFCSIVFSCIKELFWFLWWSFYFGFLQTITWNKQKISYKNTSCIPSGAEVKVSAIFKNLQQYFSLLCRYKSSRMTSSIQVHFADTNRLSNNNKKGRKNTSHTNNGNWYIGWPFVVCGYVSVKFGTISFHPVHTVASLASMLSSHLHVERFGGVFFKVSFCAQASILTMGKLKVGTGTAKFAQGLRGERKSGCKFYDTSRVVSRCSFVWSNGKGKVTVWQIGKPGRKRRSKLQSIDWRWP